MFFMFSHFSHQKHPLVKVSVINVSLSMDHPQSLITTTVDHLHTQ